ncbi:MAG: hypothetical protein FJ148_10895 [Deltaproteobacteria bacterium]|nr:hypothetical protein [Deltaproteobacteria bacterium]
MRRAWLALAVPFVAVVAAALALLWTYREPLARIGAGRGAVERGTLRRIERWRRKPVMLPRMVLLGDSLNVCATPPAPPMTTVAHGVRTVVNRGRPRYDVVDLTQPGLLPLYYYALLDDALETPVSLVVLELNLRTFLDSQVRAGEARLPGLARNLDFVDALRVHEALEREGMSAFDPPIMRLKEQLGLLYVLEGARQGALDLLDAGAAWATAALGVPRRAYPPFGEVTRRMLLSYMVDYASHPNATVIREAVRELHAARVPVIVYVSPIDVERLRGTGDFDPEELARRLEELRVSIGLTSVEWLDLHATLPSERFRDYQNHLKFEGCAEVGRPLAERALRLSAKQRADARRTAAGTAR